MHSGMPADHHQLDVGRVGEDVRAEREQRGGRRRRSAVAGKPTGQQPGEDDRRGEREQHDRVVRGIRVLRRQPGGNGEDAGAEVGLGVGERALVRMEDVGVVELGADSSSARARPRRRSRPRSGHRRSWRSDRGCPRPDASGHVMTTAAATARVQRSIHCRGCRGRGAGEVRADDDSSINAGIGVGATLDCQ